MGKGTGSVLLTIVVVVLALFGNKKPVQTGNKNPVPTKQTPPPAAKPKWLLFGVVMTACLTGAIVFVLGTGEMLMPASTPLPAPLVPPPLGLRIVGAILFLAPLTFGLGVVFCPATSSVSTDRETVAKDEILAPWAGCFLFAAIAGAWLDDFLSQELMLLVFVVPWVGAVKTLMR